MQLLFSLRIWVNLSFSVIMIATTDPFLEICLPLINLHLCLMAHLVIIVVCTSDDLLNLQICRIIVHVFRMTLCTYLNILLLMLFFHVGHVLILILLIILLWNYFLPSFWDNLLLMSNVPTHLPLIAIVSRIPSKVKCASKILERTTTAYNICVFRYLRNLWSVVGCKAASLVYCLWIIHFPIRVDMECLGHEIVLIFVRVVIQTTRLIKILVITLSIVHNMSIVDVDGALFHLEVGFVERISLILLVSMVADADLFTVILFVLAVNGVGSSIIIQNISKTLLFLVILHVDYFILSDVKVFSTTLHIFSLLLPAIMGVVYFWAIWFFFMRSALIVVFELLAADVVHFQVLGYVVRLEVIFLLHHEHVLVCCQNVICTMMRHWVVELVVKVMIALTFFLCWF